MPFLQRTTGAVDIACALEEGAHDVENVEVGDRRRAFNGDMHSTIRDRRRRWRFLTQWLTRAAAETLYTQLTAAGPQNFNGEALDGTGTDVSCHVEIVREMRHRFSAATADAGQHRRIEFVLHEA